MARTYAWAIWFKGDEQEKEGFCFWGSEQEPGMFYETKKAAEHSLNKNLREWDNMSAKQNFTIVKVGRINK